MLTGKIIFSDFIGRLSLAPIVSDLQQGFPEKWKLFL
jgi:hypothetical protein